MSTKQGPSTSAKILYRPVGLVSSIAAGAIASTIYKKIWAKTIDDTTDAPPNPLESDYALRTILGAALIEGAIFAMVRAATQRGGARAFERATGEWPGT